MHKFIVGHTYKSRDGKTEYTVVADDLAGDCIIACTYIDNGFTRLERFTEDGHVWRNLVDNDNDMMPNTVKHVRWVNLYESYNCGSVVTGPQTYETKQKAEDHACSGLIATVPVEWESEE